ncbi:Negative regulator of mitotic exit [Emydomyces testavorans]|uniref:Negative regulator of mitotic exit n=1 Tax=Emydomyces testavorans TaxID=2070801 RepID=A0AAF0IKI7_9EURO|nr:Negative regulator of mitotic exit [Emydomyces testavorans]
MAFLFKSKKHNPPAPVPQTSRNLLASEGNSTPTPPLAPGINGTTRDGDPKAGPSRPPNVGPNNLMSSMGGPPPGPPSGPPSGPPNQAPPRQRRDRAESDAQGPRQLLLNSGPPPQGPNPALFPWSQRRLNFPTPQSTPFPRYGAAVNSVASEDGDIYLMGGLVDGSTVKGDLWMIESNSGNLSCFPLTPITEGPGPRVGHASLLVGNAFIVFGGDTKINDHDTLDDTLYFLNTSSRQWSRAVPPGPRPAGRYGHSLNILGSKIYIFGGQVEGFFFNDLISFDLNALQNPGNKWEFLVRNSHEGGPPPGKIPPARTNHTIITFNDKLYLFGGTNGIQWFNDVWCYDPTTNLWNQLDYVGFIPPAREGHAAALVGDVMYVFGGRTDEGMDLGDLAAFRITTRRWYSFHNMGPGPSPRSGHTMTSFGKQIIVLGGEPSSEPRDIQELGLVYVLDTGKIRYPNEQGPTSPTGDRQPRRIPTGDRQPGPSGRTSREALDATADQQKRGPPSQARENVASPGPGGPGSRLPRASIAQAPAGPPPTGQPPNPRGPHPGSQGPRGKPPMKQDKPPAGPVEAIRMAEKDRQSPVTRDGSTRSGRELSPASGSGRRTPTQPVRNARAMEAGEAAPLVSAPSRPRSLRQHKHNSSESVDETILGSETRGYRNSRNFGDEPRSPRLTPHQEALMKELDAMKSRNAWYASELALARKAGYMPTPNPAVLDERSLLSFTEEDRPFVDSFLAMKAELAKMQANVDRQATIASKRIAEVEHQRDVAINEAAYARAKLAARGGSPSGASQPDESGRDTADSQVDRTTEISRRLALALASQNEMKSRVELLTSELQEERKAKEVAEELHEVTTRRLAELENQSNTLELEQLRSELHQLQFSIREESTLRSRAESSLQILEVDKAELAQKLEESNSRLQNYNLSLGSLREAVNASAAKAALLEKQLESEKQTREGLERKLLQLRAEHEETTAELENAVRRLKEAEELAETHAREAESHKTAFLAGLERASSLDSEKSSTSLNDQRVAALQSQVDRANELVKSSQHAANTAADKLRRAEERIAGLEAYQEQSSREGLQLRRQLQATLKDNQALNSEIREVKAHLESQQRDTSALAIQHGALKDLLGERGINMSDNRRSPLLDSPGSRFGTPEHARLRELEQQLQASMKAHEELKATFEFRELEADRIYQEKLEQLENDYQSAVHYVKGTEKMLKRMKDELNKYKAHSVKLQTELDSALQNTEKAPNQPQEVLAHWETERASLQKAISELQESTSVSISALESQLAKVKEDLSAAHAERENSHSQYESLRAELTQTIEKSQAELEQLKKENTLLENRALDAEKKVTMLLDQVESSVINYRRQSNVLGGHSNGLSRTTSNASSNTVAPRRRSRPGSIVSQDDSFLDRRGSLALDSLASELDALRSHWESTTRNYRLSNQFDFERTPTKETYGEGLSDSFASWRRRLDEEESRAETPMQSPTTTTTTAPAPTPAALSTVSKNAPTVTPLPRANMI